MTPIDPCKTDEPIEMPFGGWGRFVWLQRTWACAHWRQLANTIERPVLGGDTALCQITLATYSPQWTLLDRRRIPEYLMTKHERRVCRCVSVRVGGVLLL